MALTEQEIRRITEQIVRSIAGDAQEKPAPAKASDGSGRWLCDTAEEAVHNAKLAFEQLSDMTLGKRGEIIEAMRKTGVQNAEYLAKLAIEDTTYGRLADKIAKNKLASTRTPGLEDLTTQCLTGDDGMMIMELAPFGVIGSITPSTHPTATIINNAISMIAAGNSIVFNPHPGAKHASQETIRLLVEAIVSVGGPKTLITTVKNPTPESGGVLMNHPDVALLSITGGEAVVKIAMKTGKKCIAAGPGNPPVIVDETADIALAAQRIIDGASFDNNILCIAEKEIFVVDSVADQLMDEMVRYSAVRVKGADIDKVLATTLVLKDGKYVINRKYVGHDAAVILRDSGIPCEGDPRVVICEVEESHPFVYTEMMMPVLPIVRVKNVDEAIEGAFRAEQGYKHSALMHSTNVHNLSRAARKLNTTLFVKNAPCYAGLGFNGEGFPTHTVATTTGEGITSARTFTRQRRCVLYDDFRIC